MTVTHTDMFAHGSYVYLHNSCVEEGNYCNGHDYNVHVVGK